MKKNFSQYTRISHFAFKLHTTKSILKKTLFFLLFCLSQHLGFAQIADAGPSEVVNYQRRGVKIGTQAITIGNSANIDPNWCYMWTANPQDPSLKDPTAVQPFVNPKVKTTYTLTLSNKDGKETPTQDAVNVYNLNSAKFEKSIKQKYGYDDGQYQSGPTVGQRWKSIEVGHFDWLNIEVDPANAAKFIFLKSDNKDIVNVNPVTFGTSPQELEVSGIIRGESSIQAYFKSGTEDIPLDTLKVKAYSLITKKVAVRWVNEQNDDVQIFPVKTYNRDYGNFIRVFIDESNPRGKPHTVAITSGTDGILNTQFTKGDDKINGQEIETGEDGVCQTLALYNDVQKIALGKGEPNQLCVTIGANGFRDTPDKDNGDDEIDYYGGRVDILDFYGINTGADGICQTVANNIDVISTLYDRATILKYLNDTAYNQAVFKWEISWLPPVTINMDIDRNGLIDINKSRERDIVIKNCIDDNYQFHLFFIDDINLGEDEILKGASLIYQNIAFVSVPNHFLDQYLYYMGKSPILPTVQNTVAHELGHIAWEFEHPQFPSPCKVPFEGIFGSDYHYNGSDYEDWKNIMDYCNRNQFRKFQWDKINPN